MLAGSRGQDALLFVGYYEEDGLDESARYKTRAIQSYYFSVGHG